MKSCVWCVILCVVLIFVASPNAVADTYTVSDGGQWGLGNGGGYGWGGMALAGANASPSSPFSEGYAWGSKTFYVTEAGNYGVPFSCSATAYANVFDNGSGGGAWGAGGGSGDTPWGSAFINTGGTSPGFGGYDWGPVSDPGSYGVGYVDLEAFGSVSASCEAGAAAGVTEGQSNTGHGEGSGYADLG